MFARLVQTDPKGGGRWALLASATREELGEAALVARGFNLLAQTLDLRPLDEAERAELLASLALGTEARDARGLRAREAELLARCPRLDAPGLDLDATIGRYVVSWPGGERVIEVVQTEAQALALDLSGRLAGEEARRGVTLRRAFSGGPERAAVHGEYGPVAEDLRETELLRALRLRTIDLAAAAGVPTSETVAEAARVLLVGLGELLDRPMREGAAPSTALNAIRDAKTKTARLALKADPGEARAAELLAALRAAMPPVWLDLVPLNHAPGSRGRMFRPLGGLHKSGALKTLVPGSPATGSPITRAMVAPYLARLAELRRAGEERAAARTVEVEPAARPARRRRGLTKAERAVILATKAPTEGATGPELSHEGALALGSICYRLGLSGELAGALAERLARADKRAERARKARDSFNRTPQRDAEGEPTHGWPRLVDDLGEQAAEELRGELEELAGERTGPQRVEAPKRPPVTREAHGAWLLAALTGPAAGAYLDRAPTGEGKTYLTCEAALRAAARGERIALAVASHAFGEELEATIRTAQERLGSEVAGVTVGRVPAIDCAEGREEDYTAATAAGWNPRGAVCASCPRGPRGGAPSCAWLLAVERAWGADVVIVQHAHLNLAGAWDGRLAGFTRLVVDEAAPLATEALLGPSEAQRAVEALDALGREADEWATQERAASADALDADERRRLRDTARKAARLAAAARAAAAALAELEAARPGDTRTAVKVEAQADLGELLRREAAGLEPALRPRLGVATTNPLPLVFALAEAQRDGRGLPCLRVADPDRERRGEGAWLAATLRRPVPAGVGVLALDATADPELLAARLGRPVERLDLAATRPSPRVVQVTGSLWSRRKLREEPEALGRIAAQVAEVARRVGATRIGLVTYQDHEEALAEALRGRGLAVEARHFGGLRGTNALAGVELLAVVGTPAPAVEAPKARALVLGLAVEEISRARRTSRGWDDPDAPAVTRSPRLAEIERRMLAEELAQAIGRGARGDRLPPGGVWLWSSADLDADGLLADARWVGRPWDLGLAVDPATWDALARAFAAGASLRTAAQLASARLAARAFAALPAWPVIRAPGEVSTGLARAG